MTGPNQSQDHDTDRLHDARDAAAEVYGKARHRTHAALGGSRDAARRATAGLEANPLGIVVGGLAVGALAGALIPRSSREKELLAPVGRQISARARAAIEAAREAGTQELDARGVTRDAATDQVRGFIDGIAKAATTASAAAAKSAVHRP